MKIFKDREAAGELLAARLKNVKADLVLGIPRGGVVVADKLAQVLKLPLDLVINRKIGLPNQPELALGAVDADGETIWNEALLQELNIKKVELNDEVKKQTAEIKRREKMYRQNKTPLSLEGKRAILVDDGIATGATILSAINYLRRHRAKKVILAVPVASHETIEKILRALKGFGQVVVLEIPQDFQAVGQFYQQFEPVTDKAVIEWMEYGR